MNTNAIFCFDFHYFPISAANAGATSEYYSLTPEWLKKAEEEENRRGSMRKLYTLLDGAPRFVLEAYLENVSKL